MTDKNINRWLIGMMLFASIFVFLSAWLGQARAFQGSTTDETSNRALDGIYQNTSTEDKFVFINFLHPGGTSITAEVRVENTSPPTIVRYEYSRTNIGARKDGVSFTVAPGEYYGLFQVSASGSSLSIEQWWEYETPTVSGGISTTTTETVNNDAEALFYGFVLYLIGFWGVIWFFRRPK